MLYSVVVEDTNISKDLAVSIFRVEWLVLGKRGKHIGLECRKGKGLLTISAANDRTWGQVV
jgi:hypothetical protein